jgi:hypothetical protein
VQYWGAAVTNIGACLSPPVGCLFNLETLKFTAPATLLSGAMAYRIELWKPSAAAWAEFSGDVAAGQTVLIETEYEIGLKARWAAHVGGDIYYSDEIGVTTFCCEGKLPPAVPDAPTLEKSCAEPKITVTSPAFSEVEDAETERIEIQRSDDGENWQAVHAFTAPGEWDDETVLAALEYSYRARACNDAGCSAWSTPASISLISETLELAWLEPAENEVLSNKVTLGFSLDDSGETPNECGDPVVSGECDDAVPEISLFLDGIALPAPQLQSGTPRHGEYSLSLDTRDYASGTRVLKILARGTDCCYQKAERAVSLQNTLRRGTLYLQTDYPFAPPAGREYSQAEISFQNETLNSNPSRRYWTRHGLTTGAPFNFFDSETSDEDKAEAFDELQHITLQRGQVGSTPDRTQHFATPLLSPAGDEIHWVQQWIPEQSLSFHTTGCERVEKLRDGGEGKTLVFAHNADGSGAKVFEYELGELDLLVNFAALNAANATDAARLNDKIFAVAGDEIFAFDLDSGQATLNLAPRGETRSPRFVENVGGVIIAVFVDEALSEKRTRAYDMTFAAPKLLWSLDEAATRVFPAEGGLIVACGEEYFATDSMANAPTLAHTFAAAITALSEHRVGLQSGAIWRKDGEEWIEEVAGGSTPINALAAWEGAGETMLGVAGGESPQLIEELSNGQWIDGRTIEPAAGMSETIGSITALSRYEKIVTPAVGTPGQPGYTPAETEIALLIGTAPDGVLAALELSDWSEERGALKASRVSHLNIDAYSAPIMDV